MKLTAKSVMMVAALLAILSMLGTPALHAGVYQLRCTVGQAVPQNEAPLLTSADLADVAIVTILITIPLLIMAQQATPHPQPAYVSAGHSAALFVRPPPVR